ncbi:MAG: tetratricopeptide repeat protein [Alphaproteobacteria bacterium]|nr:tetratricopeptide repeat protein [Alphaproteobacteria bacterium]
MGYFSTLNIAILLIDLALAWHVIRSGRTPMWIMGMGLASFINVLALVALWLAYLAMAVIPDFLNSHGMRRFRGSVAQAADPGRGYREKKRQVELVGSVDAKRALAEESVKRGYFAEAIELYEGAMQGPLGGNDPTLLKGLGRARMLAGQGAEAEALFVQLKTVDPAAFDADAELDYARALALQNKNDAAVTQYEKVVSRYPGEEARARFGLLLESMGQHDRAQALFSEIIKSVKDAPGYYRSRQREWLSIAKSHLK